MMVVLALSYLVSWKAIGMGDKKCDYDEYTGAEVHCEAQDVSKEKWFETVAGAKEFMDKSPSKGIKDMKIEQKEKPVTGSLNWIGR